ncbi:MAG: hypothetical protein AAFR98_09290 [Pseudomonadota bacterium]
MTIFTLLAGIIVAMASFATLMWCVYQLVQTKGWRWWTHLLYMPFIIAGFIPYMNARPIFMMVIGAFLLSLSPAFVIANRWPTVLLAVPPSIMGLLFLIEPEMFLPVG